LVTASKPGSRPSRLLTTRVLLYVGGIGLVFLTTGIGLVVRSSLTLHESMTMRGWMEMPATIEHAELKRHERRSARERYTSYSVSATYSYEVNGRQYEGTRVSLYEHGDDGFSGFQRDLYAELNLARGSRGGYRCYVNPNDPNESILNRDLQLGFMIMKAIFAVLFGTLGAKMIWWTAVTMRKRKQAQAAEEVAATLAPRA
jgi:hypothetical protein